MASSFNTVYTVVDGPTGSLHDHFFARLAAHQRLTKGGILADGAVHHVSLLRADDLIGGQLFSCIQIGNDDLAADRYLVRVHLRFIHDDGVQQDILKLRNAGIELTLLVLGLVILAVLAEIAKTTGLFDQFRNLIGTGGLAVIQFFFSSS